MPRPFLRIARPGAPLALRLWLCCVLGALLCMAAPARAADSAGARKVLVLYSLGSNASSVWQSLVNKGLREALEKRTWGAAPDIFEERFDSNRVGTEAGLESMGPYLASKYANVRFDAIVTENFLASGFLHAHPELFPGVPRYYVNHGRKNWVPGDGVALEAVTDVGRSIGVISQVAPGTRRIFVVSDPSPRGQEWMDGVRSVASRQPGNIEFSYWDGRSFEELYRRAATLGSGDAIYMVPVYADSTGARALPPDVARKLAAVSPAPVFANVESLVLPGVAGGYVLSGERIGQVIARIMLQQPADMSSAERYVFDYPTVLRFKLRNLPEDATLLNRPESVWDLYRWQIISGLTLIIVEGLLITALVMALRDRRRTLTALHDERNNLEDRVLQRTLELLMANTKLEQLATTDPLTGIANRRKMTEQIAKELDRARRFAHPLSLLMVDIDHFKRINDTYGHEVGDRAIIAVARVLTESMRSIDLVSRFGGEEFVLLMPETDMHVAALAAERLREEISQLCIAVDGGLKISLTISVGVAASDPKGAPDSPSSLLVRSDKALYRAKKEGRDRVVVGSL